MSRVRFLLAAFNELYLFFKTALIKIKTQNNNGKCGTSRIRTGNMLAPKLHHLPT
jgi:hypothetical protein